MKRNEEYFEELKDATNLDAQKKRLERSTIEMQLSSIQKKKEKRRSSTLSVVSAKTVDATTPSEKQAIAGDYVLTAMAEGNENAEQIHSGVHAANHDKAVSFDDSDDEYNGGDDDEQHSDDDPVSVYSTTRISH